MDTLPRHPWERQSGQNRKRSDRRRYNKHTHHTLRLKQYLKTNSQTRMETNMDPNTRQQINTNKTSHGQMVQRI